MGNGFDTRVTDVKARIAKLMGMLRPQADEKPGADGAGGARSAAGAARHPTSSFRESVGKPTENERAGTAPRPKRVQDTGD